MIKKIYLIVAVLFVAVLSLSAQTGITVNGIHYLCNPQNNTASVYGYDGIKPMGDLVIPATVTMNGKVYQVTKIEDNAFVDCFAITSVKLPSSITEIGSRSFSTCSKLKSILMPESLSSIGDFAFTFCVALNSISLPTSISSLGKGVFSNCTALTEVDMSRCSKLIATGEYTFFYCSQLSSVKLPLTILTISESSFIGCKFSELDLSQYSSLRTIGESAFSRCSNLTSVKYPVALEKICSWAFEYCSQLKKANMEACQSLITIETSAFSHSAFTQITLPASIQNIASMAFYDCDSLSEIVFYGSSEPNIAESAFSFGSEHRTLYLPNATSGFTASKWGYKVDIEYGKVPSVIDLNPCPSVFKIKGGRESILIESAMGYPFTVFSSGGSVVVQEQLIDLNSKVIHISPSGFYLVKIGQNTTKVLVR